MSALAPEKLRQKRILARRLGIRLPHHDGGLEESIARLPEWIGRVDAVICPTDYVSHNACPQVKGYCQQAGKPCLPYRRSGLTVFSSALTRLCAGESSPSSPNTEFS